MNNPDLDSDNQTPIKKSTHSIMDILILFRQNEEEGPFLRNK